MQKAHELAHAIRKMPAPKTLGTFISTTTALRRLWGQSESHTYSPPNNMAQPVLLSFNMGAQKDIHEVGSQES
jgi:hypothetical protein